MAPLLYNSASSSPSVCSSPGTDENPETEDEASLLGHQLDQSRQECLRAGASDHGVTESNGRAYPTAHLINYDHTGNSYDLSENEPFDSSARAMVHVPAVRGVFVVTCLWMLAMAYLAVLIGATFYRGTDSPLPLLITKQKLPIVDEFIHIAETQAKISMVVVRAIGHAHATNFTLARSADSFNNAVVDLGAHLRLLERMARTQEHRSRYGEAPDCLHPPESTPSVVLLRRLHEEAWNLSTIDVDKLLSRCRRSTSYNKMYVGEALKWLDFYAESSTQSAGDGIDDTEDDASGPAFEEIRVANVTAPEVLWVMDRYVGFMRDDAKGDIAILRKVVARLKAVEVYTESVIERDKKCVLPATQYMQFHLARRDRTYSEEVTFRSKARHPYDDALSLLNIGLLPHLVRFKEAAEALGEQIRRCEGSSESIVARYDILKSRTSLFLEPLWWQRARGQPWVDAEHAVHWWLPGREDVYEDLAVLEKHLALVKAKVERAAVAIHMSNIERGYDDSDRERRMWKDDTHSGSDLMEKLRVLWELSSGLAGRGLDKLKRLARGDDAEQETRLYDILDVLPNATNQEIKKAYRLLTVQYHPDKNPGDSEAALKYQELVDAYHILSDSEQRAVYDRYGDKGLKGELLSHEGSTDWVAEFFKVFPD